MPKALPFDLTDYTQLVELTGRCIREDKRGFIEDNLPDILQRLGICSEHWLILTPQFRKVFHGVVGNSQTLAKFCQQQHLKKRAAVSICKKLLS